MQFTIISALGRPEKRYTVKGARNVLPSLLCPRPACSRALGANRTNVDEVVGVVEEAQRWRAILCYHEDCVSGLALRPLVDRNHTSRITTGAAALDSGRKYAERLVGRLSTRLLH